MDFSLVTAAQERIKDTVHNTAMEYSTTFSDISNNNIYLKCENLQKTGSFKVRGALNKILKSADKTKAVVASSAGNHAQGVAYACLKSGIASKIVMPVSTPIAKISATKNYGAQVILHGDYYDDSYNEALKIASEQNALFVHPFDDEDIIAGQATLAPEIIAALPEVDAIVVPAGGGGLLAGIAFAAKHIKPSIQVYGVQSSGCNPIALSFKKQPVSLENIFTIADGIAVKHPGNITMNIINRYADGIFCVTDEDIAAAIISLLERTKQVVEPAGAAAVAAVLTNKLPLKNKTIACVLSGGNIDVSFIHKIIEKGLYSRGRQMRFSVVLTDKPGSLEIFSRTVGQQGANIISVQYDRMSSELSLNETILHIGCEVSGHEHGGKLLDALKSKGYKLI